MASISERDRLTFVGATPQDQAADFAQSVREGLSSVPKRLECRHLYDHEGSRLFEAICELPEYYLTRAEREILQTHSREIASRFARGVALIELGSGSSDKTRLLIQAILDRQGSLRYMPIDISREMLGESAHRLLECYGGLEVVAVAAEYDAGLRFLKRTSAPARLILWLGSNLGNFRPRDAVGFLRRVRAAMAPGDRFLVGIDLKKDRTILEPAYDDAQGVTAEFNLNLLARINRELGGHFDLRAFRHRAVYDEAAGRIDMYLISTRAQRVLIDALDEAVSLDSGEAIHTESSYKYSPTEIDALAADAGLQIEAQWFDSSRYFSLNLFSTAKS